MSGDMKHASLAPFWERKKYGIICIILVNFAKIYRKYLYFLYINASHNHLQRIFNVNFFPNACNALTLKFSPRNPKLELNGWTFNKLKMYFRIPTVDVFQMPINALM